MQNGTAGEKINDNKKDDARKNVPETTNGVIGYEPEMGTGRKKFINDIKRLGVILLFLVLTLWQFSSLELFFKQTINNFNTELIIKNMALFATANIVLVALFHRMKPAFLISFMLTMFIGIANYYVISFRGYGIVFMDFYAIKTAAAVAGGYKYGVDIYLIAGVLSCIAGIAISLILPSKKRM